MATTDIDPVDLAGIINVTVTVSAGGVLLFNVDGKPLGSTCVITIPPGKPNSTCSITFTLADDSISTQYRFPNGIILDVRDGNNEYSGLKNKVTLENVDRSVGVAYCAVSVFNVHTGTSISQDPGIRNRS